MRLWYLFCLKLFIDSIILLIDESYDVTYHLENDPNWNQSIRYSACIKLIDIYRNYDEIKQNKLDEFSKFFEKKSNKITKEIILKKMKSKNYFIYKELICLIVNKEESESIKSFHEKFVFDNRDYEFFKIRDLNLKFDQIIINNLASPYSKCKLKKSNRFECINECNKRNNKLSKYYYHAYENKTIRLKYKRNDNQIKSKEIECLNECKKQGDDCKLIYFKEKYNGLSSTTIFTAYPLISKFDYWIQFGGLICLISNITIANQFAKFIEMIKKRINIRIIMIKKYKIKIDLKKCLNYLTFLILSILIIYLFFSFYEMITEYFNTRDYPIRKQIITTELQLKPISLVICILLPFIRNNTEFQTLSKLENKISNSDLFNQHISDIYLEFQDKKIKTDYILNESKIILIGKKRCIHTDINIKEYKYRNQLLITKLIVQFKYQDEGSQYFVYLLNDDKKFYYENHLISYGHFFVKKESKKSKLNRINRCEDGKNKWDIYAECINNEYINKDKNIPYQMIIDKDQFTNFKWTKLSINFTSKYFDLDKYLAKCNANYSKILNCNEIRYENYLKRENLKNKKLRIELFYDLIKEIEQEPSIYKLLMNMLNIQSILFGLNIFKLITIIFNYKLIKFKYNKLLIYLLCSIGFGYHFWFIFNEIINGELIYSQHYNLEEKFKIPNLIFCIKYDQNLINLNHKLTYKYLDKITDYINIDDLIYRIEYLNSFNKWVKFNDSNINRFYFLDQKCFEIEFNIEYELDQFQLNGNYKNDVIRLQNFNEFLNIKKIFYLLRVSNTMQISKLNKLSLNKDVRVELMEIDYDDKFNLIKNPLSIIYGQNYLNDVNKYLYNLIDNFKINYNLATLNLPLNNSNVFAIEDQLFDQLYLQKQNSTDYNQVSNLNFNRTFIISNEQNHDQAFLILNLILFKKVIKITNEDNYTKLILNLLNLVSLWFNIGLFDFHIYLDLIVIKVKFIFIFFYKLLIKIKSKLFIKLNTFKDHNVNRPKLKVSRFLKSYT